MRAPHASITTGRRKAANAAAPAPVMWALSRNQSGWLAAAGAQSATVSCGHRAAAARICVLISGQGAWLSRSVTQTTRCDAGGAERLHDGVEARVIALGEVVVAHVDDDELPELGPELRDRVEHARRHPFLRRTAGETSFLHGASSSRKSRPWASVSSSSEPG